MRRVNAHHPLGRIDQLMPVVAVRRDDIAMGMTKTKRPDRMIFRFAAKSFSPRLTLSRHWMAFYREKQTGSIRMIRPVAKCCQPSTQAERQA